MFRGNPTPNCSTVARIWGKHKLVSVDVSVQSHWYTMTPTVKQLLNPILRQCKLYVMELFNDVPLRFQ